MTEFVLHCTKNIILCDSIDCVVIYYWVTVIDVINDWLIVIFYCDIYCARHSMMYRYGINYFKKTSKFVVFNIDSIESLSCNGLKHLSVKQCTNKGKTIQ